MNLDSSFLIDLLEADAGAVANVEILDPDQLTAQTLVYTELGTGLDAGTSSRGVRGDGRQGTTRSSSQGSSKASQLYTPVANRSTKADRGHLV